MALSFKNRVALYNLGSAATFIFIVFYLIYTIVSFSVNYDINRDLQIEVDIHRDYVARQQVFRSLVEKEEWEESEHKEIVINPVFVEIFDAAGNVVEKSPNLKNHDLVLHKEHGEHDYHDTLVADIAIRQVQTPLVYKGQVKGYAAIAMQVELPHRVLKNLKLVLFVAYPLVLFALFFVTRLIAGKSMAPVFSIINTTTEITDNNLNKRIPLPRQKDELYVLATAINDLLDRIQRAVVREKQFTSDASHELRTPLAALKGTMEVLVRKPRTSEEYQDKIQYCISEVDRLNGKVDQLLLLARFENQKAAATSQLFPLDEIILHSLEHFSGDIVAKGLQLEFNAKKHYMITTDASMTAIIIDNILSNAIKYTSSSGNIKVLLSEGDEQMICTISDNGLGIDKDDLNRIYDQFYRSDAMEHAAIKGNGLGLSIVRRLCELLSININITSTKGSGTSVTLNFPKI